MNGFFDTLRRLGPTRLALLAAVTAGLIGFFTFFVSRVNAPAMGLLYADLAPQDSGQIVAKLEAQAVPFDLRAGGTQVWVPQDRVLRLRMSFAEQGLPRGGAVGYEIFDRSETIGATNFVQNLNFLRALEGELARTIGALGPIGGARVHLVVPKRDVFSRERQEPSASVVVRLRDAGGLTRPQVQAIQHLVASGVPGLKPARVSIVDDRGTLLARGQDGADEANATATTAEEMRRSYEQRLARTLEELLERSVGAGKVRAEVSAEMDFDRIVTNTESYDPDGQVVRSTQTVTENSDSSEANTSTAVTVTANLPEGADTGSQNRNSSRSTRSEETVNYEITKTVKSHVRESGAVRRLSVAILVDGVTTVDANGARQYQARSAEDMQRLAALARTAIGFNQQRGDTLEIANLPFARAEAPEPAAGSGSLFDLSRGDYFRIGEIAALAIVGILAILLVVRPLVTQLFRNLPPPSPALGSGAAGATPLLPGAVGHGPAALAAPEGMAMGPGGEAPSLEQMIDLNRVEGRVKASSIKKIGEIVDKHPEEAVAIMRTWMYQES